MKLCDHVSSEGGPILIADAAFAMLWRGNSEGSTDYQRACEAARASRGAVTLPIADAYGLIWDMDGAGTCDVFRDDNDTVVLVRPWLEDCAESEEEATMLRFAQIPRSTDVGSAKIHVSCGVLAVLWAAETGECIESLDVAGSARPNTMIMGSDDWGLLVSVPNGCYVCLLDEIETSEGIARRCHLVRCGTG